jgi:hypothetical protein
MVNKTCIIKLKNIDLEKVHKKYNIKLSSNITENNNDSNSTTRIDVTIKNNNVSFLDESKKVINCRVTMLDKNGKEINTLSGYKCFWCRNKFSTDSLGCPIKYIPKRYYEIYNSKITNDISIINDIVGDDINKEVLEDKIVSPDIYICDGIFCSFNCILAYINENSNNPMYENSRLLLNNIYSKINNTFNFKITPAPHWRMLKEYGGVMDIKTFRQNFNKFIFKNTGNVDDINFKCTSFLFKEDIKISNFI